MTSIIESILFVSGDAVAVRDIAEKLEVTDKEVLSAANELKELEDVNRFYKKPDDSAHDVKIVYSDFNVDALIKAFTNLLARVDIKDTIENSKKEIPKEVFTVADKIYFIRDKLTERKELSFY